MSAFRDYEKKVLNLLVSDVFSPQELNSIIQDSDLVGLDEHGGSGYYLEVSHPSLPKARIVCHKPTVIGEADGITCGFVVFIENKTLTIECHDWGESNIDDDFRDKDVQVKAVTIEEGKFVDL
jgi:hypothetical protein